MDDGGDEKMWPCKKLAGDNDYDNGVCDENDVADHCDYDTDYNGDDDKNDNRYHYGSVVTKSVRDLSCVSVKLLTISTLDDKILTKISKTR